MDADALAQVRRFLDHLENERRQSPHTRAAYARDLAAVTAFCDETGIARWEQLGPHQVRALAGARRRAGLDPRSIQRLLSALRSFYRYLAREGIVRQNPAAGIPAPKAARRLPEAPDADQMASLLEPLSDAALDIRDHAMWELLYSSGLRLAELCALDLDGIDARDATVTVTGKGRKTRIVPVGGKALEALAGWRREREQMAREGETALFVGREGRRLAPRTVQARLKRWGIRHGVPLHLHPHMLRHAFASHLLESSGDIRAVQELLGHANLSTTQVYTHLDFQHLAKVYDGAHPRARKKR